jgi:hypothetical protein
LFKRSKKRALAKDKSIQTEAEKLQLLDSRFYGVNKKILNVVDAKKRGARLETKDP